MYYNTTLIGHVGSCEVRSVNEQTDVISFSVAHNDKYTAANGQAVEKVYWFQVGYFVKKGKTELAKWLTKGTSVHVEGKLTPEIYQDKDGFAAMSLNLRARTVTLINSKATESETEKSKLRVKTEAQTESPAGLSTDENGRPVFVDPLTGEVTPL